MAIGISNGRSVVADNIAGFDAAFRDTYAAYAFCAWLVLHAMAWFLVFFGGLVWPHAFWRKGWPRWLSGGVLTIYLTTVFRPMMIA